MAHESWHNPFTSIVGPVKTARQLEREERQRRNLALKLKTSRVNNDSSDNTDVGSKARDSDSQTSAPATGVQQQIPSSSLPTPPRRKIDHFVMNLPSTALEFLDAFRGCLSPIKDEPEFEEVYSTMPLVHCHCFTRELDEEKAKTDIQQVSYQQSIRWSNPSG